MRHGNKPVTGMPPAMSEEQKRMLRQHKINHQITTSIGFLVVCVLAGFLITVGQHIALAVLK